MADGVLGHGFGPAVADGEEGVRGNLHQAMEFGLNGCARGVGICGEAAEYSFVVRDAARPFRAEPGAGHHLHVPGFALGAGDEETEGVERVRNVAAAVAEGPDGGTAIGDGAEEFREFGIDGGEQGLRLVGSTGDDDDVEDGLLAVGGDGPADVVRKFEGIDAAVDDVNPGFEGFNQGADAGAEGAEDGVFGRRATVAEGADDDAAVALFVFDEFGENAGGAELVGRTAVDSGEEGFGQKFDGFRTEVVVHKVGNGTIGVGDRVAKDFEAHPELGTPAEEFGLEDGQNLGGNYHLQTFGEGEEATIAEDEGATLGVIGAGEIVTEAEFADELLGPWLGCEPAFGTGFEDATFNVDGPDGTAGGRVKDGGVHIRTELSQIVRTGKPGDATANDADPHGA